MMVKKAASFKKTTYLSLFLILVAVNVSFFLLDKEPRSVSSEVKLIPKPRNGYFYIVLAPHGSDSIKGKNVYFDIDDDDFLENSEWLGAGNALIYVSTDIEKIGKIKNIWSDYLEVIPDIFARYDTNNDKKINKLDSGFAHLNLWFDSNSDGHLAESELVPMVSHVDGEIKYDFSNFQQSQDQASKIGTFTYRDGTDEKVLDIYAVWLSFDKVNSVYSGEYKLDIRVLFLPTLRGYGKLPDLHIAMSKNEDLLKKVMQIAIFSPDDMLEDCEKINSMVEDALFLWANVAHIGPESRGEFVDARKLFFLEVFLAKNFVQLQRYRNPLSTAASHINLSWSNAFRQLRSHLVMQGYLGKFLYKDTIAYNPMLDVFTINENASNDVYHTFRESLLAKYDGDLSCVEILDDIVNLAFGKK
jgi:hypothetical protein